MDFLQALKAHKGGLILIKSNLFWYDGRGWDNSLGRICLVLDASATLDSPILLLSALFTRRASVSSTGDAAVLLLVDGAPHWVWVAQADVELIA